ncbi:D-aminoacyl-tRNA deacylase [Aurantibacter sp.]|uniref:D-aminoacyl-tRNA deacylase n=1 Tax=Aurantibacter sp. TaxID=2807103 RepID=UPI0035C79350
MKVVIQRVVQASVTVNQNIIASIQEGLLVLVGIVAEDTQEDINWLSKKISNLRVFSDKEGLMNQSVQDINGNIIVVSQFTLQASIKKGNRPSYIKAAKPDIAIPLYQSFVKQLEIETNKPIQTGEFGADMQIELINNGPVTIVMGSKNKE